MNNCNKLSVFVNDKFGVQTDVFIKALMLSPNAQGYIIGAISELLLKQHIESLGFDVERIKEKWEGDKHPNHHGDFYIRKKGTANWFVLESKGVKSNSEKWHKLNKHSSLRKFFLANIDKLELKSENDVEEFILKLIPTFKTQEEIPLDNLMEKVKVLETHFVAGAKSKKTDREIATPRNDEFHIMALDLFLRTRKHEFIFTDSKKLKPSQNHPHHLQQNYIVGIILNNKRNKMIIHKPWSTDFKKIFDGIKNPILEQDKQVDLRINKI